MIYCNPQQMPQILTTYTTENGGDKASNLLSAVLRALLAQTDHTMFYILVVTITGCNLCTTKTKQDKIA